jgi:site-specific DNA recombinase
MGYYGINYDDNNAVGTNTRYYVCGGKTAYRGPLQGKCVNRNVPADWLEELVWSQIVNFVKHPKSALKTLREEMAAATPPRQDVQKEIAGLESSLATKDLERQRVMGLYRRGTVGLGDVEAQIQEIDAEEDTLRKSLSGLRAEQQKHDVSENRFESAESLLRSLRDSIAGEVPWESKRDICFQLVKNIVVGPHETTGGRWTTEPLKVTVRYRFV